MWTRIKGGKKCSKNIYILYNFSSFFFVFFCFVFCTNLYKILKCVNFFFSSYNTSSCTDIILCKDPETALRMDVAVSTAECSGGCKKWQWMELMNQHNSPAWSGFQNGHLYSGLRTSLKPLLPPQSRTQCEILLNLKSFLLSPFSIQQGVRRILSRGTRLNLREMRGRGGLHVHAWIVPSPAETMSQD